MLTLPPPDVIPLERRLEHSPQFTPNARLHIEQPAKIAGAGTYSMTSGKSTTERGAIAVPLKATATVIELRQR